MSQQLRRILIAVALSSALLAVLPAPAQAIQPWDLETARLATRIWLWLEKLGIPGTAAPAVPTGRQSVIWEKEGSMIDPNGLNPPPPSVTQVPGCMSHLWGNP